MSATWHTCETCGTEFKHRWQTANRFCSRSCDRPWHDEAFIARCVELWSRGLSMSQIAAQVGVSKNVIAGISHRNDFPSRRSPIRRAG